MGLILLIAAGLAAAQSVPPSNRQLADPAIERKVNALLKQMTLEEKLGQLVQYNDSGYSAPASPDDVDGARMAANPTAAEHVDSMQLAASGRLGSMLNTVGKERTNAFQRVAVEKSRLHIPLLFGADIIHGFRTIYPQPLGLAASWDPTLVEHLSRISAGEAVTAGVRWFYSPMVDVSRDSRWGRITESAGEDPYLGSAMAAAYVRGYQQNDLSKPDSVAACVKHYAAYGAAEAGREYNTTDMSESRLRQVYLPPYKAAVEAGAASMMSSFNSLNGLPATANPYLMNTILRQQWGFDGLVISDYTAIMELRAHGIALDAATAARKALLAGVDVDMMSHYYDTELPALIKSGKVPMAVVDEAVRRVLRVKFALGLFEHPYAEGPEVTAAVAAHRPLVRQAAEESFVLLQNKDANGHPVLPLANDTKTVALIGPLADDEGQMVGSWSAGGRESEVVTMRKALEARAKQQGSTLLYARGTDIDGRSEAGFAEAVSAAQKADLVLMALGESGEMSSEGGSRSILGLPGNQQKLLAAVVATGKPVVLLAFSGRALTLPWEAEHVAAIMAVWFPGTEAGNALASVLYGDVAPSGKLPISFPRNVGQEPLYYAELFTGRPPTGVDLTHFPKGEERFRSRYVDVPNDALFPFGFGLSYTTFDYRDVAVSRAELPVREARGTKPLVVATATVTNTGKVEATEVVECYVRDMGASLAQPVRSLKGFTRVTLKPGESKKVSFNLGFDELSFFTNEGKAVIEPSEYTVWIGGSSTATGHANFTVTP
ncbi:MAG: glycoside hydrolase family 3 N-terminal domain-containing protein [Acidobacteriota bacterium]|nr:glycoside hydrolase family 3 N-terminal domain-containing protein [Acidobacteriota bacterium]